MHPIVSAALPASDAGREMLSPRTRRRMRAFARAAAVATIAATALLGACTDTLDPSRAVQPGFTPGRLNAGAGGPVCPAIGANTDCGTIITFTDAGVTIATTGQG